MGCAEIINALDWAQKSQGPHKFPVTAFFTKHSGTDRSDQDYCWYAVGAVNWNSAGYLEGDLKLYANGGQSSPSMELKHDSTVGVEIYADGTVSYQQKIGGKPVGGMPPTKLAAKCVEGALLAGVNGSEVVAVGVRLDPEVTLPT
jgi:hypothetical protein